MNNTCLRQIWNITIWRTGIRLGISYRCDMFVLKQSSIRSYWHYHMHKNVSISCVGWHWVCCIHIFKLKNADYFQTTVTELLSNKCCAFWGNKRFHTQKNRVLIYLNYWCVKNNTLIIKKKSYVVVNAHKSISKRNIPLVMSFCLLPACFIGCNSEDQPAEVTTALG